VIPRSSEHCEHLESRSLTPDADKPDGRSAERLRRERDSDLHAVRVFLGVQARAIDAS
jgi:hypothetical protein